MKFQALGLPEPICQALEQNGITEPTAVQNGAIPVVLAGRDLISSARTGSGKTLAYALPVITRLLADKTAAALVLVPTREIGVQVQQVMQPYLRAVGAPPAVLIIGGVSFGPQIQNLKRRPPVIIATPGRLNDHLTSANGKLRFDHMKFLVLDEADRMLDMGFLPQVKQILKHLTGERQTLLFSATMPSDLARACKDMMRDPERVAVDTPNQANTDIEQRMLEVAMAGKNDALLEALKEQTESVLVFARTKRRTDRVAQFLEDYGVRAERIHGDRSQAQRQKAIEQFRGGKVKVLVATDIAARGLDIPLVELVINFDLPEMKEDYVHRIGRTGRAGAQGVALSFVTPEERGHWASISGQRRGAGERSQRPSNNSRPFGRGKPGAFGRGAPATEEPAAEVRAEQRPEALEQPAEEGSSWNRPAKKDWSERPRRAEQAPRREGSEQPPRRNDRFARSERPQRSSDDRRAPRDAAARGPRPEGESQIDRPQRSSRFQRWGQPRAERNPKHIFTGREGDEARGPSRGPSRGPRRDDRAAPSRFGSRNERGPRQGGDSRFANRDKPRFGGHGRSAPPSEGAPRGRWSQRPNRSQPKSDEGSSSW